jgi:hypothetical protein
VHVAKRYVMRSMQELHILYAHLLDGARRLPPGKERCDVLKELGLLRLRLDELSSVQPDKKRPRSPQSGVGRVQKLSLNKLDR